MTLGKIGIDEKILNKPGRLTEEEFALMKKHTLLGEQIIDNLKMYQDEKLVKFVKEICRWHHERYDGRGIWMAERGWRFQSRRKWYLWRMFMML